MHGSLVIQFAKIAYPLTLALVAFISFGSFKASEPLFDALGFALSGSQHFNFHPAHLLYPASVRVWYLVLGPQSTCDAWCAGQVQSMLGAAAAVLAFYALLERLLRSRSQALLASLFLIFTNAFWQWATQVESYAPITAMLAVQAAMLIRKETALFRFSEVIIVTFLLTIALLYHQGALLFCIPLSYYLVSVWGRHGFVVLAKILVISGVLTILAYILVFIFERHYFALRDFIEWVFTYPLHPEWGTSENLNMTALRRALKSQVSSIVITPKEFDFLSWTVAVLMLNVIVIVVAWNILQVWREAEWYKERAFLLIWFLVYFIFLVWWAPHLRQFLIPSNLALLALGALVVRDWSPTLPAQGVPGRLGWLLGIPAVCLLLVSNLTTSILPSHLSRGPHYEEALGVRAVAPENCAIIVAEVRVAFHLQYFFGMKVLRNPLPVLYGDVPGEPFTDLLGRRLTSLQSCKVISVEVASPHWGAVGRNGYTNAAEWYQFVLWWINACAESFSGSLRYDSFLIRRDNGDRLYVVTDTLARRETKHFDEIMAELDTKIRAHREDWDHTHSLWWRQNREMLSNMDYKECGDPS
jgi:hypothetical protein